ncbi:hypothetical protein ZWY2020_046701 [Hordeum vulgare]|nr:hypothetical protein ZWY2020_046701 [Hordeum vulgare]
MRNLLSNSFELNKEDRPPGNVDIELGLQGDVSGTAQPGLDGFFEQEIEKLLETLTNYSRIFSLWLLYCQVSPMAICLYDANQNSNEESKVVTKASAMKDITRLMEKDVN